MRGAVLIGAAGGLAAALLAGAAAAGTAAETDAETAAGTAADAAAGERLFRGQCMGCHSLEAGENRAGPTLHGLFGRRSGTLEGFDFSQAMAEADIAWTPEALDVFLADPAGVVPGTKMVLWGLAPERRRQIIAYLAAATEQR